MASFKTSDGCNIAYQLHLSGKPGAPRLALIHSLALGGTIWDGVVQRLANKVDVLTWDCRGHSASDRMPGPCHARWQRVHATAWALPGRSRR